MESKLGEFNYTFKLDDWGIPETIDTKVHHWYNRPHAHRVFETLQDEMHKELSANDKRKRTNWLKRKQAAFRELIAEQMDGDEIIGFRD